MHYLTAMSSSETRWLDPLIREDTLLRTMTTSKLVAAIRILKKDEVETKGPNLCEHFIFPNEESLY